MCSRRATSTWRSFGLSSAAMARFRRLRLPSTQALHYPSSNSRRAQGGESSRIVAGVLMQFTRYVPQLSAYERRLDMVKIGINPG